jgi:four helix bundle protein
MSNIGSHNIEKLIIWQKSVDLACDIYKITASFPAEEKFGLVSQMRRSGVSIPSNIAEGAGRGYNTQFAQFLSIASGSTNELFTQLIISNRLGFIHNIDKLKSQIEEIGKMNTVLRNKLRNNYAEEDMGNYDINEFNP